MKLFLNFITASVLLVSIVQAQTKRCPKAHVCFALDESGSVNNDDFLRQKGAVKNIAQTLARFDPGSTFAAVGFSDSARVISRPTSNLSDFNQSVDSIVQAKLGTSLGAGLNACRDQIIGTDVPRFIVLITDGVNTVRPTGVDVQQGIKDQNITIATIGVGSGINVIDLRDVIASTPSLYTEVNNFQQLELSIEGIIEKLCKCPEAHVCFALDESGSILASDFDLQKEAVKSIAAELARFDPGSTFAAVGFSSTAELISSPTADIALFNKRIDNKKQSRGGTSLGAGLNMCRDQVINSAVPRFIVLITDGMNTAPPKGISVQQIIKNQNITIATVGVGRNIDTAELRDIIASSPSLYTNPPDFSSLLLGIEDIIERLCKESRQA